MQRRFYDLSLFGRPHLLRALDELVEITRGTRMKLQYSHAIFVGRRSFRCKDELKEIIYRMRENGVDAQFDIYSELLGVSVITVIMPTWYQALSAEEKRRPVNKLRFSLLAKMSIALLGFGWDDITIAYVSEGTSDTRARPWRKLPEKGEKTTSTPCARAAARCAPRSDNRHIMRKGSGRSDRPEPLSSYILFADSVGFRAMQLFFCSQSLPSTKRETMKETT